MSVDPVVAVIDRLCFTPESVPGSVLVQVERVALPSAGRADLVLVGSMRQRRQALALAGVDSGLRRFVLGALTGSGADRLVGASRRGILRPDGLVDLLTRLLDLPGVGMAARSGPPRPNRKPVLRVSGPAGSLVAVAKVGIDEVTSPLVVHEASIIEALTPLVGGEVSIPRLLTLGAIDGHPVLVLAPLGGVDLSPPTEPPPELAERLGSEQVPLVRSGWWRRQRESATGELAAALDEMAAIDPVVAVGWSHGDWSPWNVRVRSGGLVVWDWERAHDDVPVGVDTAHFAFQVAFANGRRSASEAARAADAALERRGVDPMMVAVELVELARRYADRGEDGRAGELVELARTRIRAAEEAPSS